MSIDLGSPTSLLSRDGAHPNPMFDYLSGFVPRRLKDLFKWCEYLYYNSTHIFAALKKFAEYPITAVQYQTDNEALKKKFEELLNRDLSILPSLILAGTDLFVYGNHFCSIYFPFVRYLKCPECNSLKNIKWAKYRFKLRPLTFYYECDSCEKEVAGIVEDKPLGLSKNINIIRWDPKLIDIDHNPITGESVYYYNIPSEIREKVEEGSKHLIDTMPMEFLQTLSKPAETYVFRFNEGQVYHMKIAAPSGIDPKWGFPPLTSTLKQFFFAAVLRKANEAIALDHILPYRIVYPDQGTNTGDPLSMINLSKWVSETRTGWKKFRIDPLHISFAPVPVGVANVGGQGRALMVSAEIQAVEDNIIAAMGVPREFLYGGLSAQGSEVTLKMLENQLMTYTSQLDELLQWIADNCANFLGWEKIDVELAPFTLVEDIARKQLTIELARGGILSWATVAEEFGWDLSKERTRRVEEAIDEVRTQSEIEQRVARYQNSLARQAQQAMGGSSNYDPQQVLAQADQLVMQFEGLPHGERRSQLDQLKEQDYVMYSVVVSRLRETRQQTGAPAL